MKILVTGAAGFIGFHTTAALLARGDTVVGIDNLNDYYDVRLKEARLALRAGKLEEAFRFALEPSIREHRRAVDIRNRASRELLARAQRLREKGDLTRAYEDVKFLLSAGERSEEALSLDRDLRRELDLRRDEMTIEGIAVGVIRSGKSL